MRHFTYLVLVGAVILQADTPANRTSIEAVIASTRTAPANIRGGQELRRMLAPDLEPFEFPQLEPQGTRIESPAGTLVVSHEPMGEAVLLAAVSIPMRHSAPKNHFVTRSIVFHGRNHAVAAATYVQFVYSKVATGEKTEMAAQIATITQRDTDVEFALSRGRAGWVVDSFRVVK